MISVIIPNWNGARYIRRCLSSLTKQTFNDFDVWFIDNGSTDESVHIVASEYPSVHLVRLPENVGFAAGVNRGIKASKGDIVAPLNIDTECDPDWLAAMNRAFEKYPGAGSCASLMLEMKDDTRIASAGDFVSLSGTADSRWKGERLDDHPLLKLEWVFGPCGGAAGYRRSALQDVGLFEESFFIYFEDVDLAFRLQRAGYRCIFAPDSIVWHLGHSIIANPARRAWAVRLSHRNQIWMIARNFPRGLLMRHWTDILAAQMRSIASSFLHSGAGPPSAVLKGKLAALAGLPRSLRYRRWSLTRHPGSESLRQALAPPIMYRSMLQSAGGALKSGNPEIEDPERSRRERRKH